MYCTNCGQPYKNGALFCSECGARRVVQKPQRGDRKARDVEGRYREKFQYEFRAGYLNDKASNPTIEVTLGVWNRPKPELKMDIRKWYHNTCSTGITLTEQEVRELRKVLDKLDFGKI